MAYQTFSLLIADGEFFSRWIEVVAVDIGAAKADVTQTYNDIRVVQWSVR